MALTVFGPKYKDRIESIVKYIFIAILWTMDQVQATTRDLTGM